MGLFRYSKIKRLITQINRKLITQILCLVILSSFSLIVTTSVFAYFDKGGLGGLGARPLGMGGSFTALADDGLAVYYNPAGLAQIYNFEFLLSNNLLSKTGQVENFFSGQVPFYRFGTLSLSYWQNLYKDNNARETLSTFSYALPVTRNFSLGVNLKHLTVKPPFGISAQGQGFDLGFLYQHSSWKTNFGFLVQDINTKFNWGNGYFEEIPRMYKLGIGWFGLEKFIFVYDLDILPTGWQHRLGSEYQLSELISLRAGYTKFIREGASLALGFGLKYKDFFLDYAYTSIGQEKMVNWFSFAYKIGRSRRLIFKVNFLPKFTSFSPNPDAERDQLPFDFKGEGVIFWQLEILSKDKTVKTFSGVRVPGELYWDGKDETGNNVSDGEYEYRLVAEDRKGETIVQEGKINVDQTKPQVEIKLSAKEISPDADGKNDILTIALTSVDNRGVKAWNFKIATKEGASVKELKGTGELKTEFVWDGKDDYYQATVKEGDYFCMLTAEDDAGNKVQKTEPIKVAFAPAVREVIKEIEVIKEVPVKPTAPAEEVAGPGELKVVLKSTILFDYNSIDLTPSGLRVIDRIAEALVMYSLQKGNIEGHADAGEENPEELSRRRAEVVYNYFVKEYDISPGRLTMTGFAAQRPVALARKPEGVKQNPRVEITIIEK